MNTRKLNPKILLVEDDAGTYNNLKHFFTEAGFEIALRKDGKIVDSFEKAVVLLNTQQVDMALLDIEINGSKNGLDLGRHIVDYFRIPVIFLTGKDTFEHRLIADRFARLPIIEKLPKSIPNELLLKSVNFLWTKIQLESPPAQRLELRAVEMTVDQDNFDTAVAVDETYPVKTMIDCSRIHFISSFNDKVKRIRNSNLIHVDGNKAFRTRSTIDQLVAILGPDFKRISKSVALNPDMTQGYSEAQKTCMVKNYLLKVGKDYWEDFLSEMKQRSKPIIG